MSESHLQLIKAADFPFPSLKNGRRSPGSMLFRCSNIWTASASRSAMVMCELCSKLHFRALRELNTSGNESRERLTRSGDLAPECAAQGREPACRNRGLRRQLLRENVLR